MRSAWTFAGLLAAVPVLALAQPPGAADSAAWRKANVVAGVCEFVADTRDAAVFIDPSDEGYDPTGLPMEMTVRYEYFAAAPGRAEQSASARMGFDCEAGRTRLVLTQYHARHNLAGAARVERSNLGWTAAQADGLSGQLLAASCRIRAEMASGAR